MTFLKGKEYLGINQDRLWKDGPARSGLVRDAVFLGTSCRFDALVPERVHRFEIQNLTGAQPGRAGRMRGASCRRLPQ